MAGLLGAVAALFVLAIVGVAVFSSADDDPGSSTALPSYTPPPLPTFPGDDRDTGETRRPGDDSTPRPRYTPRPRDTSSSRPSDETSRPPVTLDTSLERNTVYTAGTLPKVKCPGAAVNIYNNTQLRNLILRTGRCMDQAWAPALRRVGIDWEPPGWAIVSRKGRGACGDFPQRGSYVPYYCPRNMTIYASTSALARGYGNITTYHGAIVGMMAHEYGHHVQTLTGLGMSHWRLHLRSNRNTQLALSRRFELQANCFGGMAMRAMAGSYPIGPNQRRTLYHFFSNVGDWPGRPRDHGSPPNSGRWFRQGFERTAAYQCNTWRAPSSTVS
ncbi:neutral zinc metallopeptidase [Bailinhaonella thermotolerans]|uniref:neutral zinc metallopeptidase n=1 Tax=Bailinhaonella thermotolerans TaxID=1070861 RepID=UPI00192A299E|nr:neutral zinc metallopeptidase [Bailinhaonella thermotolerans]